MKKFLVLALTLTFVLAFAMSALAVQPNGSVPNLPNPDGTTNGTANFGQTGDPTKPINTPFVPLVGITDPNKNLTPGPQGSDTTAPYAGVGADGVARIHSGYTANTNACASCHATHTAVGLDLLQWEDSQTACYACHDGSLGVKTYNVVKGTIGSTTAYTKAGRFYDGTDPLVNSISMHNFKTAGGAVELKDAPGGKFNATAADKTWVAEFECVSCHAPHGAGGNARILNPDINGAAKQTTGATLQLVGPNRYAAIDPNTGDWAVMLTSPYPKKIAVKTNGTAATYVENGAAGIALDATKFTVEVKNNRTEIVFGAAPATPVTADFYAGLKVNMVIDQYLTANETVSYGRGFNNFCGVCHTDYNTNKYYSSSGIDIGAQQKVDKNAAGTTTAWYWLDAEGKVPAKFASHAVDFLTGTYTKAIRHTVGRDASSYAGKEAIGLKFETYNIYKSTVADGSSATVVANPVKVLSCITCHVSHGTDSAYWQSMKADYKNYAGFDGPEVFDSGSAGNNRGSNLKRMPNMATCETCHQKGLTALGHDDNYTNSGF